MPFAITYLFTVFDLLSHAQFGCTALMLAAEKDHADCARLLLDAGADKNAKDEVRASAGGGVRGVLELWWRLIGV